MPQEALPNLEHCVSSMGKTRDLDGTVDRVAPPPDEMWPILYFIKRKCEDENIELPSIFEEGGGTHFGVMKMQQFESTLTVNFSRVQFTQDTLQRIRSHYGVGYQVSETTHLAVGWRHAAACRPQAPCLALRASQPCPHLGSLRTPRAHCMALWLTRWRWPACVRRTSVMATGSRSRGRTFARMWAMRWTRRTARRTRSLRRVAPCSTSKTSSERAAIKGAMPAREGGVAARL